ncbi:hypothetical protein BKA65DRAFT_552730 [Rhexocercosporidium sp. MPI-PUGE-AT-0058]|nr:hypothetical protein BKA65DRAFT_552730 [Rhexocercosporidium sp. MPI-PUGE-AT-0058]
MLHSLRLKLVATSICLPEALKALASGSSLKPDETIQILSRESGWGIKAHWLPSTPSPPTSALEDVEDAIRWVISQSAEYDLSSLSISGFSAGANLALVVKVTGINMVQKDLPGPSLLPMYRSLTITVKY